MRNAIRNPMVRPKVVLDQLLRQEALSPHRLKALSGKPVGGGERHQYTPADVRKVKEALLSGNGGSATAGEAPPKILNFRMSKGGVGKTTIAGNLASALSFMGYRVLMIDGDPQSSLSSLMGVDSAVEDVRHIGALMRDHVEKNGKVDIDAAVRPIYPDGMLDLIPSDITMTQIDAWLMAQMGRDTVFERFVTEHPEFFGKYDVVLVDSAPGTTSLTLNFMVASHGVLAVVLLDRETLKNVSLLNANIHEVNRALPGKKLEAHIIANGYHTVYSHCREALSILRASFPANLDETVIPHSTGFVRQQSILTETAKGPLVEQDPGSYGAQHIFELAHSLVAHYGITLGATRAAPEGRAAA